MSNVNYTPNSHKYRAEQQAEADKPKVNKVVSGTASRKKNELRKFADIFAPGDMSNIKNYLLMDVAIPTFKKLLSEMIRIGADMLIYGDAGRSAGTGHTAYNKISYSSGPSSAATSVAKTRTPFNYDDIVLPNRVDAEEVLRCMGDILDTYKLVSVATLYEMCGIRDHNYMNHKYGWMDLRGADIIRVRDGWLLKLPKAMPLD
jgi:hypothetical protein